MNIGLIPLDERPCNTRYPRMIAEIAGARVLLPPPHILSVGRRPADCAALSDWLQATAPTLDGLIVSCEMLGYGSLLASRISTEPASIILPRLDPLRGIKRQHPALPIFGFNLFSCVSNANDATEEPAEWATFGEQLYRFSQLLDQRQQKQPVGDELDALVTAVPEVHRQSFLRRRLRNHVVNLGIRDLLAEGVLDLLLLSSDDTSPYGLPSREKRWLSSWSELLGPGDRLLMYPGADEVSCVLLARLLNERSAVKPIFTPLYAPHEAAENVAAYEDGPIHVTLERQIHALGGQVGASGTAISIAVNPPLYRRSEWEPAFTVQDREQRWAALQALVAGISSSLSQGRAVMVADVAYPNGADPALIELLQSQIILPALAAYGGWNTAGNTIGAALAQASAAQLIGSAAQHSAQERFLLHRFVEDWGYQHLVRANIRQWLQAVHHTSELTPALQPVAFARIEHDLALVVAQLPGSAGRYTLVPGSVRLPWQRLFEVNFELTSV